MKRNSWTFAINAIAETNDRLDLKFQSIGAKKQIAFIFATRIEPSTALEKAGARDHVDVDLVVDVRVIFRLPEAQARRNVGLKSYELLSDKNVPKGY
jgi:hypothetical protein